MLDKMAFIGFASLYLLLNVVAVMGVTPDGPCSGKDLYSVLDLSREAKPREIKRAMVKLAKIWHPDKNKSPEAPHKMACINHAYEILSDENRKRRYDYFGDEENIVIGEPHKHRNTGRDEEEEEPAPPPFTFTFDNQDTSDEINSQEFFKEVLPASNNTPVLLYFYNDFCEECDVCAEKWNNMREVVSVNYTMHRVHSLMSNTISKHCSVVRPPVFVVVNKTKTDGYILIHGKSQLKSSPKHYKNETAVDCTELAPEKMSEYLFNLTIQPVPKREPLPWLQDGILDDVCPFEKDCYLLLVEPSCAEVNRSDSLILCYLLSAEDQFNDSLSFQFGEMANSAPNMKFAYVDRASQWEFVKLFDLTMCGGTLDPTGCRKVIVLHRNSMMNSLYHCEWFCGENQSASDLENTSAENLHLDKPLVLLNKDNITTRTYYLYWANTFNWHYCCCATFVLVMILICSCCYFKVCRRIKIHKLKKCILIQYGDLDQSIVKLLETPKNTNDQKVPDKQDKKNDAVTNAPPNNEQSTEKQQDKGDETPGSSETEHDDDCAQSSTNGANNGDTAQLAEGGQVKTEEQDETSNQQQDKTCAQTLNANPNGGATSEKDAQSIDKELANTPEHQMTGDQQVSPELKSAEGESPHEHSDSQMTGDQQRGTQTTAIQSKDLK